MPNRNFLRIILPPAVLIAMGLAFSKNASQVWALALVSPSNYVLAVAVEVIGVLCSFFVWKNFLNRDLPARGLALGPAYYLFSAAFLARYLMGGAAWQLFSFIKLSESLAIKKASTSAYLLTVLVSVLTAGLVGGAGLFYVFSSLDFRAVGAVLLLAIGAAVFLSHPAAIKRALRMLPARFSELASIPPVSLKQWMAAFGLFGVFVWLGEGLALVLLNRIVNPSVPYQEIGFLMTCSAFAYLGGVASLVAPAGLGVRDGALVFLLSTRMPLADAIFITLSLRFCHMMADLLFSMPLCVRWVTSLLRRPSFSLKNS